MLTRRAAIEAAVCTQLAFARRASAVPAAQADRIVVAGHMLTFGGLRLRCSVGHGGLRAEKIEGDGATPIGRFPLRSAFFRADRLNAVATLLPIRPIAGEDAWCDTPGDAAYNTLVRLPYPAHAEELWRDDHLYDLLIVIGYNDNPVVAPRGSAIFLHVARPDFGPTDGCIAVKLDGLLAIARAVTTETEIDVQA